MPSRPSRAVEIGAPRGYRNRQADQKAGDDARMVVGREPVGEVEHDAGEEAGLGDAQQEAHDGEARRAGDQRGQAGEDAPGDHDARDPYPRADLFQDDVAGHLEDEIAPVERAERRNRNAAAEMPRSPRMVSAGEADIDPVDIGKKVGEESRTAAGGDRSSALPIFRGLRALVSPEEADGGQSSARMDYF